jgi:hypothetical protein
VADISRGRHFPLDGLRPALAAAKRAG